MFSRVIACFVVFATTANGQFGFYGNRQQQPNHDTSFNPQQGFLQSQAQNFFQNGFGQRQNWQQQQLNPGNAPDFVNLPNFPGRHKNKHKNPHSNHNHNNHNQNGNYDNQQNYQNQPTVPLNPQYNQQQVSTNRPAQIAVTDPPNARISQKKCTEYSKVIKNKIQVASLSNNPSNQEISYSKCDASTALIIGGQVTKKGEFPHMAAIGWADLDGDLSFKCGGSLISENFVLTAAHCENADRSAPSIVRLGEQNLKVHDAGLPEEDYPIAEFISHELYDKNTMHHDIALIRLARNVKFTKVVRPACLQQTEVTKKKTIACGWGYTEAFGSTSDELLKVDLDIIDIAQCRAIFNDAANYDLDSSQICAGVLVGGKDTCSGDSGGPIQIVTEGSQCIFHIIGITSYGTPYCGVKNSPGIYTKVSHYLDWIEQKVWV